MRRLIVLAVSSIVMLAAPAGASADCADADTAVSATTDRSALRAAVLCLTNEARTTRGLPPLTAAPLLDQAAQVHADAMIALNFFDHDAPDGTGPGDRVKAVGYAFSAWGENIAKGYSTPRDVVLGWMKSEGHCHNVLSPQFTELGVGVAPLAERRFGGGMWGQSFGRPAGVRAPSNDRAPSDSCPQGTIAGPGSSTPAAPVPEPIDPTTPSDGSAGDIGCFVPPLRGLTLAGARRALVSAGCTLGSVRQSGRGRTRLRVLTQTVPAGTLLAPDAKVGIVLRRASRPS